MCKYGFTESARHYQEVDEWVLCDDQEFIGVTAMDKKLSLWFIILAYSALYVLPDGRSWKEIVNTVSGVLRFLTLDRYKSCLESESVPIIFFADPIVLCSLCWSSLVAHPNQRVIEVQWTHR